MMEEVDEPASHAEASQQETVGDAHRPVRTGNATVDEVLASLEGIEAAPVDEHVPVYEQAHDVLRRALDGPRDA